MMRIFNLAGVFFLLIFYTSLTAQKKADIAFILRGFDNSCFFCDPADFDAHAQAIVDKLNDLSFGKVKTYVILDNGIDERAPTYLQSLRDIDVLQASLDGWPGSQWDWLRDRTDFWYVVPDEYRPIIADAIAWMKENKLDFQSWATMTEAGTENYFILQSNVQRMGSSAAADYLLGMRMPEAYDPEDYEITQVILHSAGSLQIAGGGAAASLNFFGVQNAFGAIYPSATDYGAVAYIGATPLRQGFYSTAVHEAIHSFGMGTHDQDPANQVTDYSIMYRANPTSISTLPAWDRYYWTHWLSQNTITHDSSQVYDLQGRTLPADTNHPYIYEVIAGDERGRGGTYREKYNNQWYSYQVDAGGTLSFLDNIDNVQRAPRNYVLVMPKTVVLGEPATFRIYSDGEAPVSYFWKQDEEIVHNTSSNEWIIDPVTESVEGNYKVLIANQMGGTTTHTVHVEVCSRPLPPVLTVVQGVYLTSSAVQNTWYRNGVLLRDTAQQIFIREPGVYTAVSGQFGCTSEPSTGVEFGTTAFQHLSSAPSIRISPNPFRDAIYLDYSFSAPGGINLEIYTVQGKLIFMRQNVPSGSWIPLPKVSAGVYLARLVQPETGLVRIVKLLK